MSIEAGSRSNWWTKRPWRQIQTNLREIDMIDIDADRFVADLQEFKTTSVLINAAGIIASYPTKLPFHFQSPYLQGDSLKDIIEACHEADIAVTARTDFSKVRKPIYEQHPEWAYKSVQGNIVDYNGDVHVCLNSEYQQSYAIEIIRELLTTHDFDGIFFNMGGYQVKDYSYNYHGICQCDSCKRKFGDMFGLPLPTREDMSDPVFRKYKIFKNMTLKEHSKRIYDAIMAINPDLLVSNNLNQRGVFRQESNTAIARALPHWQYDASDNTKYVVSSYKPMVSSNTTVDFIDYQYRHVTVSPHQQELRLYQNLANGGGLDYYLIGRLDNHEDKSGYERIKQAFAFHSEHQDEFRNIMSKSTIALLRGPDGNTAEYQGWFRILTENHFPFDAVMVPAATGVPLDKYKAIIIPDYQPIGDELARKLDAFAHAGGVVISVSRSGFADESYENRSAPALKCLGIRRVNEIAPDMTSACFKLNDKTGLTRFPVTDLAYLDGSYIYADYEDTAEKQLQLIPPHMFGPPERCYYTQITDHPGFTINSYGKGKGIFIPWQPGALFHRQGHTNTIDLMADLLEHAAGLQPIGGNLSPMVEATVFAKEDGSSELLQLVNASGHFGVTFYAPVTMSDLEVSIPYDKTQPPQSVRSLVTGKDCEFTADSGTLTVKIPSLKLFEAIKIS
ncbi:beta-galactosidase trimerization domain-containing protein [Paenibacillus humicola]|uniref:beta-galactosidase trimerization domain-containing protein n=1 Tax=Paenibacillus humicola TaxID=3110540 RepID=UPI00237B8F1B|nr:beta-galactosidase trimerization domain-containing protein [Paenibacillus humicola]